MSIPNNFIVSRQGYCPIVKDSVSLMGIYNASPDGRNAFAEAHCEVIDNLEKPVSERKSYLGDTACEDPSACPLYSSFEPFVK